jgi:mRNA interferase RelE/StbE
LAWAIEYTETAQRQLRKLDKPTARRILDFMDERIAGAKDPRSVSKALQGPLGSFWSYRVGDFRVICEIQDPAIRILVIRIGNRKEVYR